MRYARRTSTCNSCASTPFLACAAYHSCEPLGVGVERRQARQAHVAVVDDIILDAVVDVRNLCVCRRGAAALGIAAAMQRGRLHWYAPSSYRGMGSKRTLPKHVQSIRAAWQPYRACWTKQQSCFQVLESRVVATLSWDTQRRKRLWYCLGPPC